MKELILSTIIILLVTLQSCQNKPEKNIQRKDNWDFTKNDFEDQNIRLLNVYDIFHFNKQSDSIIIFEGEIFQGWKSKSLEIKDTLRLTEKYFVQDSIGNRTQQLLSYSKKDQTYFQLIVTKKELTSLDGKGQPKIDTWFDYKGKIFINKKGSEYFSDFLYEK